MDRRPDSRPLTGNPVQMPDPERRRFAPRAATRNGDAHAAVAVHAQQVPPGTGMADEVEGGVWFNGFNGFRGCRTRDACRRFGVIREWKTELHL